MQTTKISFSPATLAVSEIFGPTLQGEGPSLGKTATFLRLGHCNLRCTFCDTPYSWDWRNYSVEEEVTVRSVEDVVADLANRRTELLVITGGEPMLQQTAVARMLELLGEDAFDEVEMETNGTLLPQPQLRSRVTRFNVSPKLSNAGMSENRRIRPKVLRELASMGSAVFKFVVSSDAQMSEIESVVERTGIHPIYVMPEGRSADEIISGMQRLSDDVISRGWRLTTRAHVLIWGDKRAV